MKKRFTIIDYAIIILVICAVVFAFIHLTADDSSKIQKTAFDTSTVNKIPDIYLNYYKDGYVVKANVEGFNASNGEKVSLNGTVKWMSDGGGNSIKLLIDSNNKTYLTGLYRNIPEADIYLDKISLESDGSKYDNLVEVKINPENVTSLNDLTGNLTGNYEISTEILVESIDPVKMQEISNMLQEHEKRKSIKSSQGDMQYKIILEKATKSNVNDANSILGNINGLTNDITIRIYNCTDDQLNNIKNNYEVVNIRNF